MSEYETILAEAKTKASGLAKEYIPRLYKELVEVEKLDPIDAGDRIKNDLIDTWSRSTIYDNLPDEAKKETKPKKNDIEEKIPTSESIVIEQSTSGKSETPLSPTTVPDFEPVADKTNNDQYDKLAERYNKLQEDFEGLQAHNDYQKEKIDNLQLAVKVLDQAIKAKPLVQITSDEKSAIAMTEVKRNPNRGFWVKFDLSNIELTRPLINITNRMRDRPKYFYLEILGDEVIEVSENKL